MRIFEHTDVAGKKHKVLAASEAEMQQGISQDPPNIEELDWEKIKVTLHNQLVQRGLVTKQDLGGGNLTGAILAALRPALIQLYKEHSYE